MKINNKNIEIFKAKLSERVIGPATIDITSLWENQFLEPIYYTGKYKFKPIKLVLDIVCTNNNELELMKSNLIKELCQCTIKFDDIEDITYSCIQNGDVEIEDIMPGNQMLTINLYGIAEGNQEIENLSSTTSKTINVDGTSKTPCKLTLNLISATTITITGLSENNITLTNVNGTVIIDGSKCVILENNVNAFGKSNLKDFPSLNCGTNNITFSIAVNGSITYKPRYI